MSRIRVGHMPADWRDLGPGCPTSYGTRHSIGGNMAVGFQLVLKPGPLPTTPLESARRRARRDRERARAAASA